MLYTCTCIAQYLPNLYFYGNGSVLEYNVFKFILLV